MKALLSSVFAVLVSSPTLAQFGPMPANQVGPSMITQLEAMFSEAAVTCLKDALVEAGKRTEPYLFSSDYRVGQLWVATMESVGREDIPTFICTPNGLADTPEKMGEAVMALQMVSGN